MIFYPLLIFIPIALIIYWVFIEPIIKNRYIIKNGIPAIAKITNVKDTGFTNSYQSSGGSRVKVSRTWHIYFDIEHDGKVIRQWNKRCSLKYSQEPPKPGDRVNMLIHPTKPFEVVILL